MRITGVQLLGLFLGILVSLSVLVAAATRLFRVLVRIDSAIGLDEDGKTLRQNVTDMKAALNNGLRSDIRSARDHADEARIMAGRAAAASSVANQHAEDAIRATNALRAEVNALTNVAMQDHNGIWRALRSLGVDRRHYAEDDDSGDEPRTL